MPTGLSLEEWQWIGGVTLTFNKTFKIAWVCHGYLWLVEACVRSFDWADNFYIVVSLSRQLLVLGENSLYIQVSVVFEINQAWQCTMVTQLQLLDDNTTPILYYMCNKQIKVRNCLLTIKEHCWNYYIVYWDWQICEFQPQSSPRWRN